MPTLGFTDNDGVDVGNKYVTKEYAMTQYPSLFTNQNMPGMWATGNNSTGQIGDGTTVNKSSPVHVQTATGSFGWKQVANSAGSTNGVFSAGIKTDGSLWTWGRNTDWALGAALNAATNRSSPITVAGGGTNWTQVTCGYNHGGAIKSDGSLWVWGSNSVSQLGISQATGQSRSSPTTIAGAGTNWKQVSFGYQNSSAVKTDGTLWVWGDNSEWALGDGSASTRSSPNSIAGLGTNWVQTSIHRGGGAAVKSDGTLWLWGTNRVGRLGINAATTESRSSPVTTSIGGTTWRNVQTSRYNTFATKTDGTLWGWGDNAAGQLGDVTTVAKSSPIQVGGATSWRFVSMGTDGNSTSALTAVAAVKTDGTLWVWGDNTVGKLGDGTTVNKSSPITGLTGGWGTWKAVAAGATNIIAINEADGW